MWEPYKKGFKAWLQLEKSLADNSVEAYLRDIDKFTGYLQATGQLLKPEEIKRKDLERFI
ncbi:MAG TPA: site-specific integrase, partial [Ferruginibacter sp.]|nr:site-specific integrase [Ferruginibacter sp.]